MAYRTAFSLITFSGATMTLEIVWNFSDTMNGLMSIPNLICLHMALPSGRFCGREWPRCGASGRAH